MQTVAALNFDYGKVPYLFIGNDLDLESQQKIGLYSHIAQETKSKFWGLVFECFAQHCSSVSEALEISEAPIAIAHFKNDEDICCWKDGSYLLPDSVFVEFENFKRVNANDCAKMNWYLYQCAKRAVSRRSLDEKRDLTCELEKLEWKLINDIMKFQFVLAYPRPSDNRKGYLSDNGISLALQLVR